MNLAKVASIIAKRKKGMSRLAGLATILGMFVGFSYFGAHLKPNHIANLFMPESKTSAIFTRKVLQRTLAEKTGTSSILNRIVGQNNSGLVIESSGSSYTIKDNVGAVDLGTTKGTAKLVEGYPSATSMPQTTLSVQEQNALKLRFFADAGSGDINEESTITKLNSSVSTSEDSVKSTKSSGGTDADDVEAEQANSGLADELDGLNDSSGVELESKISNFGSLKKANTATGVVGLYCGVRTLASKLDAVSLFTRNKAFIKVAGIIQTIAASNRVGKTNPVEFGALMDGPYSANFDQSTGFGSALNGKSFFNGFNTSKTKISKSKLPTKTSTKFSKKIPGFPGIDSVCRINNSPVVQGGIVAANAGAVFSTGGVAALIPTVLTLGGGYVLVSKLEPVLTEMLTNFFLDRQNILSDDPSKVEPSQFADAGKIGSEMIMSEEKRSLGGVKLNSEQQQAMFNFYSEQSREEFNNKSVLAKLFSTDSAYSPLAFIKNRFVDSTMYSDSVLSGFMSFLRGLNSNLVIGASNNILSFNSQLTAFAEENIDYGINEYEFEPELLEISPTKAQEELFGNISIDEILKSDKLKALASKYQTCFTSNDEDDIEKANCNQNVTERRNFTIWHMSCLSLSNIVSFYDDSQPYYNLKPCGIYYGKGNGDSVKKSSPESDGGSSGDSSSSEQSTTQDGSIMFTPSNLDSTEEAVRLVANEIKGKVTFSTHTDASCNFNQVLKFGATFGNLKGGNRVCVDSGTKVIPNIKIMELMKALSNKYSIVVSSFASDGHSPGSRHFSGNAIDLGSINGIVLSQNSMKTTAVKNMYIDIAGSLPSGFRILQKQCLSLSSAESSELNNLKAKVEGIDGCDHIHIEVSK